jgi:hypothetical protein
LHLLRETSVRKEQALAFPVALLLVGRDRCTGSLDGYALDTEWTANAVTGSRRDTGARQASPPRRRLFGFRNRKFAANPMKEEAYTIAARVGNLAHGLC